MKKPYVGRDDDIVEEGFFRSYEEKKKEEAKIVEATYVEPANYFPEETRKKFKLGEYAEE